MMMPDRYLEAQTRPSPKVKNPYSAARRAAAPVATGPQPGQTQPNFAAMPDFAIDPMLAQPPQMPAQLLGMPSMRPGQPGSEDLRKDKYSVDYGRGKNLNVYQEAPEYQQHLNTVMESPQMQGLSQGVEQMKQLRGDFLRNMPQQTDLSPVMALADFLSKGKGNAQAAYKRPSSYEDVTSRISGLLGEEQKARQQTAQLAYEQAGGLKKGTEEAQIKTGMDTGRDQGYKIPQPHQAAIMVPFNQGQAIGNTYEKVAKDANDAIRTALETRKKLENPGWYTSNALKGSIVQSIGVNRITQNELFLLGGGSQDFLSQVDRAFQKASSGDSLLASDRHAIEKYNELTLAGAIKKRDDIKKQMGVGYNGLTVLPGSKVNEVMSGRDTPVDMSTKASEEDRAHEFASKFMDLMKGGK